MNTYYTNPHGGNARRHLVCGGSAWRFFHPDKLPCKQSKASGLRTFASFYHICPSCMNIYYTNPHGGNARRHLFFEFGAGALAHF